MIRTTNTADREDLQSNSTTTLQSNITVDSASGVNLDSFDFFRWFHSKVRARVFFLGALLAFIGCTIGGQLIKPSDIFRDFHRFHQGIEPVSSFYPTISELKNIVTSRVSPGQTLVIIGGNSVLNGVGQPVTKLWSARLQELLGKQFCVINLAFPGGEPFDGSYFLAEALRKQYPKLIFVSTANPGQIGLPCGSLPYRHFYWQAFYSGVLMTDADRGAEVERLLKKDPDDEIRLGACLNHIFAVSELWNAVNMRWFSTVWSQLSESPQFGPFCARKHLTDNCQPLLPVKYRYLLHQEQFESDMKTLRSISEPLFEKKANHSWQPNKAFWSNFQHEASTVIPAAMRKRILMVLLPNSPYFVKRLSNDEQARQSLGFSESCKQWETAGFHSIEAGKDFCEEDYVDRLHLAPSGGSKLANQVAAEIVKVNSENKF
jgi:hypothetical protein